LVVQPETQTKRQATQHGCLPSLLSDGDKGIATVCGEDKIIFHCADYMYTRTAKAEQKSFVLARQAL